MFGETRQRSIGFDTLLSFLSATILAGDEPVSLINLAIDNRTLEPLNLVTVKVII
jgi:hypothetical protein